MNPSEQLVEHTKHIRAIHFTLILFSFSIAYLLYTGWTKRGNLANEIQDLAGTIGLVERSREDIEALLSLQSDFFAEIESDLTESLSRQIELEVITPSDERLHIPVRIEPHLSQAPSTKQRLKYIRQSIEQAKWIIRYPIDIKVDKSPIDEWLPNSLIFKVHTISLERISITDYNQNATLIEGFIDLEAPDAVSSPSFKTTGIMRTANKRFPALFEIQTQELSFEDDYFRKTYPSIYAHFEELKHRRISDIIADLEPRERLYEDTSEIDFIGLKFAAKDIGVISPFVILVILTYLAAHLDKLSDFLRKTSAPESDQSIGVPLMTTWIGLMEGRMPKLLSLATIGFTPTALTFIAIEFFTDAPRIVSIGACAYSIILSSRILFAAGECRSKHIAI